MAARLSKDEASAMLEKLYGQGASLAIKHLEASKAHKLGAEKHLTDGYYILFKSGTGKTTAFPVRREVVDSDRHGGTYYVHISLARHMTPEAISESIRAALYKIREAKKNVPNKEKPIGEYSLLQAKAAINMW